MHDPSNTGQVLWIGSGDSYFLTAIVPQNRDESRRCLLKVHKDEVTQAGLQFSSGRIDAGKAMTRKFAVYVGPKYLDQLDAITGPDEDEVKLSESINYLVPDIDIQDLPVPLSIVAVDLLSGQRVVLEKGSLQKAVCASSAIPGIFPPVPWDDMLLADIGVIESVPTVVARMYASDLVIGVDVGQDPTKVESCDTALQVMMRIDDISEQLMRRHLIEAADLIVRPNVGGTPWYDFTKPEEMISEGRRSGHRALRRYNSRIAA